jgi:hypothetical protein
VDKTPKSGSGMSTFVQIVGDSEKGIGGGKPDR